MKKRFFIFMLSLPVITLNACSHDAGTGPDNGNNQGNETRATFSSIQSTVLSPTCAVSGCHNGTQTPNLSSGVAYSQLVNVQNLIRTLDYIKPNNADSSYLYLKVIGQNISGLQMPRNGTPLSQAVTDSIKAWINAGALNN